MTLRDADSDPIRQRVDESGSTATDHVSEIPVEGVSGPTDLKSEVRKRFGVLPNFFQLAPQDEHITQNLWGFALFGYLDNPLPSLFKERLFVYLSRFCDVRYCIVRHVGFLLGLGRPSGDANSRINTVEEVIRLVQWPLPLEQQLERHLELCASCARPLSVLPESDSELEKALFSCAAHVFLQTSDAPRCLTMLKSSLGPLFEHLNVFLAFIRTAHYWTRIHPELEFEDDIKGLLDTQHLLTECLLNDPQARFSEISPRILDEVLALRESSRNYETLSQEHEDLLQAHHVLRDREREQEALVEEHRRIYEKALSNTPDLQYVLDLNGRFRFVNRPFLDLLGKEAASVLTKTFADLGFPTALVDRLNVQFEQVIRTGRQVRDETPLQFHESIRHYEYILAPVFGIDGAVEAIVGANRDVTEAKLLREQLEHERSSLKYIFEKAPAFVALLSGPEYIFELANPAHARLVGDRDLIGKRARDVFEEEESENFFELLDEVYRTGTSYEGHEKRIFLRRTAGGPLEERHIDFVFQPVFEKDGSIFGIVIHGIDVSGSVEARKVIEAANHLKDEFLATLSHELRNPLNSIIGYSQILLRSPEARQTPLIQKAAESIYSNARSQSQLIDDLLDLSRLQTGKLAIDHQLISLAPLVGDAVETVRAYAVEKQIKLDVDLPAQSIKVNADPLRIQQIVWNLANNAVKFTPQGGRVTITLTREQNEATIVVVDTGKGIESEFLPHVFEMFRQSDSGTTRVHRGLGIGLALVKQLVELNNGQVSASSPGSGLGASFTVRLPLYKGSQSEGIGVDKAIPAGCQLTATRILVADDSSDSLDVLAYLLTEEGAIVETAASGKDALRLAVTSDKFDLVISDIAMPEMDGFEFLRNLRAEKRYLDIPVIALTGFGREEDLHRAEQAGFATHLTKPLDFDSLIRTVRLTLGK